MQNQIFHNQKFSKTQLTKKKLDPSKNRKGFISIISINNLSRVKLGED